MITLAIRAGEEPLVLRFMHEGKFTLEVNLAKTALRGLFADKHQEVYTTQEIEALKNDIIKLNISRLHLHSPFGFPFELLDWMTLNYPTTITLHDYAWVCPRVSLDIQGKYCKELSVEQCNRCMKLYKPHPELISFVKEANWDIEQYRERFNQILGRAETVFAGAYDVITRMKHYKINAHYKMVAHPVVDGSAFAKSKKLANKSLEDRCIKVALFGAVSDIKGFHVLIECAEYALKEKLPVQFIVFGYTMNDELCQSFSNIKLLGKYKEEELESMVQQNKPHIAFFPNQCPETFSYTLSHSMRLGVFPVVSDIGAVAERVRENGFGFVYDFSAKAAEICDVLINQSLANIKVL